jgi:hypothetical protein
MAGRSVEAVVEAVVVAVLTNLAVCVQTSQVSQLLSLVNFVYALNIRAFTIYAIFMLGALAVVKGRGCFAGSHRNFYMFLLVLQHSYMSMFLLESIDYY